MTFGAHAVRSKLRGAVNARSLRLWSGLVLGLFLLMHFSNIGLGLISTGVMDAAAPWLMAPWRTPPGTALLSSALLAHFCLALKALYRRQTLRMSRREAAQLALGLLIPFLLVPHVVVARIEPDMTGHAIHFHDLVRSMWIKAPLKGLQQAVVLVVAWSHGCLGLWFWLRTKVWFPRFASFLFAGALLVPVLALLGFTEAGKQLAASPVDFDAAPPFPGWVGSAVMTLALYGLFAGAILAVLAARLLRMWNGRHSRIRVTYPDGQVITVPAGYSILEASRLAQIPHASMCGGRGRCSTCRIRVPSNLHLQPGPGAQEQATLARFKAKPGIRLACQLRPTHDIAVFPIFMPAPTSSAVPRGSTLPTASHERELAILFCDLRGFTRRAEQWLPFDTVFVLNRYFEVVGEAVGNAGGYLDKFIGDGALALFGLNAPAEVACRQALDAAARIAQGMERLNMQLESEQTEPLRIAMGLHAGPAIVGDMGYGQAVGLTAIGDGINVASRLEGAAKEFDVEVVLSSDLARRGGIDPSAYEQRLISVRGRVAPVQALVVREAFVLAGAGASQPENLQRSPGSEAKSRATSPASHHEGRDLES